MAYEAPITISKAINNIRRKQYVLPSIQREFVWDQSQIERLFDSLMRDYPISTFLFWKVEKSRIQDFQFYEFLKHYHEKNSKHNVKADLSSDEDVIAILDGQQRLTSMYIALTGSYAKKMPYYRWDSPHAFPKKKLYLNLLSKSEDIELEYEFKFKADDEVKNDGDTFWFEAGKILEFDDISKVMEYLMDQGLTDTSKHSSEQTRFALNTLNQFFNVIHQKGSISYFLEEDEELDKVLQIFIRINSGGTKLSYSDLLLSIATAQWKEKDAREVIHEYVDEINQIGDGFKFNKDLVLKSCLVLSDIKDIKFKVDNFTKENMKLIESKWDEISDALRLGVKLVSKFGYNRDNLIATNSMIPIAYYLYKNERTESFLHSSSFSDDRAKIKEWLARALLMGTFGGQPDSIYPVMRTLINDNIGAFPLQEIIDHYKGKRKSILFSEDEIENILELEYGKARTYCALTLLYPSLNYSFKYHQDHIHPKSLFNRRKLSSLGITDTEKQESYLDKYNKLSNLQLLQATENTEKSSKPFKEWLNDNIKSDQNKNTFLIQHHISPGISLKLEDFEGFYQTRREILKTKLQEILGSVTNEEESKS